MLKFFYNRCFYFINLLFLFLFFFSLPVTHPCVYKKRHPQARKIRLKMKKVDLEMAEPPKLPPGHDPVNNTIYMFWY